MTNFTCETKTSSAAYGRLLSVTGNIAGGNRSFTHGTYGRVSTTTDSPGYASGSLHYNTTRHHSCIGCESPSEFEH